MTQFFQLSDLGLATSSSDYLADWLAQMTAQYPDYTASAGNLEYIQALIFASWAADCAQLASAGSTELFRQFGTQLINLPYQQGVPAQAVVTVTAASTSGAPVTYTLPAGTQFTLDDLGFMSASDVSLVSGTSATVTLIAVETGTAYNTAGSGGAVQIISPYDWVAAVTLVTQASQGVDQEDDDHYLARLTAYIPTMGNPVTANDYATTALDFTPAASTDQQLVGRSTAIDGYNPSSSVFTVTTASGNAAVTVTTAPGTSVTAAPGATVTGTNIPASTYIAASPAPTTSGFSLANAAGASVTATGTGSGIAATVGSSYGNQRIVTVAVTDSAGLALNSDTTTAVQTWFQGMREVSFVVNVIGPTVNNVWVTCSVHPLSGWANATVQSNVQAALLTFFDPAAWGLPSNSILGWQNYTTIYRSKVMNAIQTAGGVDYVEALAITASTTGSEPALNTTTDVTLTGPVALPAVTTTTIPTSAVTIV